MPDRRRLFDRTKRAFDVVAATFALIVLSPVMCVTALLVALRLGRPVIFRQKRPGLDGRVFEVLKFRSMLNLDEHKGIVTNEQRMTAFGAKLRSLSLDELPSLANVVRGEMSLVGPRPLLVEYLDMYTPEEARRHEVRPGLTGLAQVSGRNTLEWERRFELDVYYVDHRSWALDLSILARTVLKVLHREGIQSEGHAVGAPFLGSGRQGREQDG